MRVFTDASTANKLSGIAFVAINAQHDIMFEDAIVITGVDNNTAELEAILFALRALPKTKEQTIILSDSLYATNCIKRNKCRYFEQETLDEIQETLAAKNGRVMWIKGHTNDGSFLSIFNKEADSLANRARKDYIAERKKGKRQLAKQRKLHKRGQQYE